MSEKSDVKRAIVLSAGDDLSMGGAREITGKKKKKKKKQASALKPFEKSIFNMAKSADKATKEYRDRHEKSNAKKKNGWIRDYPKNMSKALSKMGSGGMGIKLF